MALRIRLFNLLNDERVARGFYGVFHFVRLFAVGGFEFFAVFLREIRRERLMLTVRQSRGDVPVFRRNERPYFSFLVDDYSERDGLNAPCG